MDDLTEFIKHEDFILKLIENISSARKNIIILTPSVSMDNKIIRSIVGAAKRGVTVEIKTHLINSQDDTDPLEIFKNNRIKVTFLENLVSKICIIDEIYLFMPSMSFTGEVRDLWIAYGLYSIDRKLIKNGFNIIASLKERKIQIKEDYRTPEVSSYIPERKLTRDERFAKSQINTDKMLSKLNPQDRELFQILRRWRNDKARDQQMSPFIIFHNKTLVDIAVIKPRTKYDLLDVKGIGRKSVENYGEEIIEIVEKYLNNKDSSYFR